MKRYIIVILTFLLILPISVNAKDLSGDNVTLNNCVDGNSARFMLGVNEIKVKFLRIETEEKIKDDETDEITDSLVSDYVCSSLKSAKKIRIEYEPNVEKEDKFGRIEAWVFVDDILLQEDLVKNGYAKIMYVNEDFTYLDKLQDAQDFAKKNNLGIWKDTKQEESKDTKEDNKKNKKKSKGILEIIFDFIADLFNQLFSFIDDLIKNIF